MSTYCVSFEIEIGLQLGVFLVRSLFPLLGAQFHQAVPGRVRILLYHCLYQGS